MQCDSTTRQALEDLVTKFSPSRATQFYSEGKVCQKS